MVHISHNVTEFEFFYEPFYVSLDSAPAYDERFEGYGFTRNTQVRLATVQHLQTVCLTNLQTVYLTNLQS